MLKETQSTQQALSSAFYITGGTLRGDAACYVRRQADESLFESLSQGQFCYVLTSRQMGKSSLMIRTAERLRESGTGVVVLDLTAVGQNLTAEQWYDGLLNRIGRQLQLEDELESFWLANPRLGPLQRWMNAITEVVLPRYPGRLVIFIDEIDTVRSLPFTTDEFFAGIREFYNRRTSEPQLERLTFCLLGVASPSDLIRDTRMTPFNIGRRIELNDFTEEEAAPLAQGLGRDERMGADLLKRVLHWTGGHPYLTQRLCLAVAKDDSVVEAKGVDNKCEELFFTRSAQEGDDNLVFVRERILRSDVELAGLLTMYDQVHSGKSVADDETSPLITALHLSGIARHHNGHLTVRNRIYDRVFDSEWVKEHMPDAELRRQRAAYRRGIIRAAGIAAVILIVISALAIVAYQQRNLARNREETNRQQLYAAEMNLAAQAWEDAGIQRMTDLLDNHIPGTGEKDLRGFEWFYLWGLANSELRSFQNQTSTYAISPYLRSSVIFFPDNRRLATSGFGPAVRILDILTGKQLTLFTSQNRTVWSIDLSPDGRYLAFSGEDPDVEIRDTQTRQPICTLKGHSSSIHSIRFSSDGAMVATAGKDNTAKLWNVTSCQYIMTLTHPAPVVSVGFSPDGRLVASGAGDYLTRIWDSTTGRELRALKGQKDPIFGLDFSPNGKYLVTGAGDGTLNIWDLSTVDLYSHAEQVITKQPERKIIHNANPLNVKYSPDGSKIAVAGIDRIARIYSSTNLELLNEFKGHGLGINSVAFSNNGRILASSGKDGIVKLWAAESNQETTMPLIGAIMSMVFTSDNRYLLAASWLSNVIVFDTFNQSIIKEFPGRGGGTVAISISPDQTKLITTNNDFSISVVDIETEKHLLTLKGHTALVGPPSVSNDNRYLVSGSEDHTVRLWDLVTGKELYVFKAHKDEISKVVFAPDGKHLATASGDGTVIIWDIISKQYFSIFTNPAAVGSIAYNTDGRLLAVATADGLIRCLDVTNGKIIKSFKGHHGLITNMEFFPDGTRLVSGSFDGTLKIWDVESGNELLSRRQNLYVQGLAISRDGNTVAASSIGKNVLMRSVDPERYRKNSVQTLKDLLSPTRPSLPAGWNFFGVSPDNYETGVDQSIRHGGKFSGFIRAKSDLLFGMGSLTQAIRPDQLPGKRIRLSGYVKTSSVTRDAALQLHFGGPGYIIDIATTKSGDMNGTAEWKRYEIVVDVPPDTRRLTYGLLLKGGGQIWVDDLQIEMVDTDLPVTGLGNHKKVITNWFNRSAFESLPSATRERQLESLKSQLKNLPLTPINLDFEMEHR